MSFLDRLFKKNSTITKVGLDEALERGLITKEEFFRLEIERTEQKLKDYLLKSKPKK